MTIEEETVEKIVLSIPESKLEELREAAAKADITVKDYILRLIDQDLNRSRHSIAPEKLAAVMRQDNALSRKIKDAQNRFDLLTKQQAEATVAMINAKMDQEMQKAAEIQAAVMPQIMEAKNRILNEIRGLLEHGEAGEEEQNDSSEEKA